MAESFSGMRAQWIALQWLKDAPGDVVPQQLPRRLMQASGIRGDSGTYLYQLANAPSVVSGFGARFAMGFDQRIESLIKQFDQPIKINDFTQ
jgi:hypothetical protein